MNQRKNRDRKADLLIKAYESVLTYNRKQERNILNKKRDQEIQKNRPPSDYWYEIKTSGFHQECFRNRVSSKPDGQNLAYLKKLKDPHVY